MQRDYWKVSGWGPAQVKQYVPEIMKAVVNLPEDKVCGAIGLCASSLHGARAHLLAPAPLSDGHLQPLFVSLLGMLPLQAAAPQTRVCSFLHSGGGLCSVKILHCRE